jgi:hypothetical protein
MMTVYDRYRFEPRVRLRTRVEITGRASDGSPFTEETETLDLSAAGACVALRRRVDPGSVLTFTARGYQFRALAVVRSVERSFAAEPARVGLEFLEGLRNPLVIWSPVGRLGGEG